MRWNIFIVVLALFLLVGIGAVSAHSWSGAGSEGDPYQITTYAQLSETRDSVSSFFKLMNDIDCLGNTWVQIPTQFTGQWDGNGYAIKNLYVNSAGTSYNAYSAIFADAFGSVSHVQFKNLVFYNATSITAYSSGQYGNAAILSGSAGGWGGAITKHIYLDKVVFDRCYVGITGSGYVYSMMGMTWATIYSQTSDGATFHNVSIFNSSVGGSSASTQQYMSALFGETGQGATIVNSSYSYMTINTPTNAATQLLYPFAGKTFGTLTGNNVFYDNQESKPTSGGIGTGLSTSNMKTQSQFTGWDFVNTWVMSDGGSAWKGYPVLNNSHYFSTGIYSTPPQPVASFTKDKTSGAYPLTVTFTDTSTNTPTSWHWNFGDGSDTNHTVQNPVHTYAAAGEYHPKHEATNAGGTDESDEQTINVYTPPTASFTKNVTSGTIPFYVAFTSTSTGDGTKSYYWVFADGNTSTSQNPTHRYVTAGTFNVNLTVTSTYGSSTSATQEIISTNDITPVASFTKNKTYGTLPFYVQFTDTSTNTPTSWYWQFGDGSTSTLQSPSHEYTTVGTFYPNLTATNSAGSHKSTASHPIQAGNPPVSSFTVANHYGVTPFTAVFTFTGSGATSYVWTFGDGVSTNVSQQNPVHTYSTNNNFTVYVRATSLFGTTQSSNGYINTGAAPSASFTTDTIDGKRPLTVQFTSTSSGATSYLWTFGDGNTSTLQNPSHVYDSVGVYNAYLTVYNQYSQSTSGTQGITVGNPPIASFTKDKVTGANPLTVQFTDTSSPAATSWWWLFGDGFASPLQSPSHQYTTYGVFNASLKATNSYGETTTANQTITVLQEPSNVLWTANISDSVPQTTTSTRYVKLTPSFTGTNVNATYQWAFRGQLNYADGQISSSEQSPTIAIDSYSGAYRIGHGWINLTVTNEVGVAVYNHTYNVDGLKPVVGTVTATPASGSSYPGTSIQFGIPFDSLNGAFPYNVSVNYGDGTNWSTGQTVPQTGIISTLYPYVTTSAHNFTTSGIKAITITGTNIWGVSNTYTFNYNVVPIPELPAAIMRWSNLNGVTVTSVFVGDETYYAFNTVSRGHDPPYVGLDMDVVYWRLYKQDTQTSTWLEIPQPKIYTAQYFGSIPTGYPIVLTAASLSPYRGYDATGMTAIVFNNMNITGSVKFTPTDAGSYRMYLVGVSLDPYESTQEYYTYGYIPLTVTGKPLDVAATGDWATNFGGDALKLVIALIIVIVAVSVPFLITRQFNAYIEMIAAVLAIGACYMAELIDPWVVFGLSVLGVIVIFFMWRGGGGGGDTVGEDMG